MKRQLIYFCAVLLTSPVYASFYDANQINNIYENEASGLRFYEAGQHEKAFSMLKETAAKGLKRSQYILGFMLMKGEGVERNVLAGMALIGLATEANDKDWQETYERFYSALNDPQKALVDARIIEYRELFGADTQGITCARTAVVGQRKIGLVCRKGEGFYPEHELQLP